jgi:hypothetical protein
MSGKDWAKRVMEKLWHTTSLAHESPSQLHLLDWHLDKKEAILPFSGRRKISLLASLYNQSNHLSAATAVG